MEIHTVLRRGFNHKHFCEDNLMLTTSNNWIIGAVFDGCSSGTESYFASSLFTKILRKAGNDTIKEYKNKNAEELLKLLLDKAFSDLRKVNNILMLDDDELLATMLITVIHIPSHSGIILACGDGVVSINGKHSIIDQDNTPEYPAYDIFTPDFNFNQWYKEQKNKYFFDSFSDISVASDGILSFDTENGTESKGNPPENFLDYLLTDTYLAHNKSMLGRKCNIIKNNYNLSHYDDLSIVRIINKNCTIV